MYLFIITAGLRNVRFGYQTITTGLRLFPRRNRELTRREQPELTASRSVSTMKVTAPEMFRLEKLVNRGLLEVSGGDSSKFLQGLITNDIGRLKLRNSMYTLFLNIMGRIIYDAIIYETNKSGTFLVEVDADALKPLRKHMEMYRVRRSVTVSVVDNLTVWVLYNPFLIEKMYKLSSSNNEDNAVDKYILCMNDYPSTPPFEQLPRTNHLSVYRDPRLSALGVRIISSLHASPEDELKEIHCLADTTHLYRHYRFKLGVCEGSSEIPFGQLFPFDVNADLLNGVSFNKGCYIGQELTARTYHTGVVRKRIMPVLIDSTNSDEVQVGMLVVNPSNKSKFRSGKLIGVDNSIGLALLRVREALEVKELKVGNTLIQPIQPIWWPNLVHEK